MSSATTAISYRGYLGEDATAGDPVTPSHHLRWQSRESPPTPVVENAADLTAPTWPAATRWRRL